METVAACASGVVSKIGEYMAEATVNQVRYLCCLNNIVEDLEEEKRKLKLAEHQMTDRVRSARNDSIIIYDEVKEWQSDVSKILEEVEGLRKEIDEKKSCLSGWCPNCCCRYWLGRKATKKTINVKKLLVINFDSLGHPAQLRDLEFSAPKYFDFFKSSKDAFNEIIKALREDEIRSVGLYGMGGAGKTSLAIKLATEVKVEKFFDEVVMVAVSQTPNFKDIQCKLARKLGIELKEENEEERAQRLNLRFTGTNGETKKILLILDDVWDKFDWSKKIGFPSSEDNKYCKILLTTRKKNLCNAIGCELRIALELLDENEGLTLLKKHAGLNDDSSISQLNDLPIKVATECKGLPLAIATVGSALEGKDIEEWKLVLDMLQKSELDNIYEFIDVDVDVDSDIRVYKCLKWSYDRLTDKKMKLCFLLCSLFPEDYRIQVEELVPYGIGLDLFPNAYSFEEVETQLHVTLNSLKASCLLLDASEKCVKMHDMVRDTARWITSKEDEEFMTKFKMELVEWSNEEGWERSPSLKILLLSGIKGQDRLQISGECFKKMKDLKVLILQFADVSMKSLESLTNIRVLQVFDCTLRDISYLKNFNKLKVICHQSCTDFHRSEELAIFPSNLILTELTLDRLPSLTSFFPQNYLSAGPTLEVLKISKCPNLTTIFVSEAKMQDQLRELTIEECKKLEQINFKDGADEANAMNNKETVLLPELKKLSLKALPSLKSFCPAACQQPILNLETLSMEGLQDQQICARILSCLRDVQEFYIWDCGINEIQGLSKSSTRILTQQNLTKLDVRGCPKLRHIIVPNLFQLKDLTIMGCEELEEINIVEVEDDDEVRYQKMPRLECLWLQNLGSLSNFCPLNYHFIFPSLQRLIVEGCPKIETRFSYCRNRNGSVHMEGKPPKDDEHAPPKIWCEDTDDLRTKLHPYMEKMMSRGSPSRRK